MALIVRELFRRKVVVFFDGSFKVVGFDLLAVVMVVGSEHGVTDLDLALLSDEDVAGADRAVGELFVFKVFESEHDTAENAPDLMLLEMVFFLNPQVEFLLQSV